MRGKFFRHLIILLWLYTFLKFVQTWPTHWFIAVIFTSFLFTLMLSWLIFYQKNPKLITDKRFRLLFWTGSSLLGFWATFVLLSIPIDITFLTYYIISIPTKLVYYNSQKIHQVVNLSLLLLAVIFTVSGFIIASRRPPVKTVNLAIPNLPPALDHLKIIQISDLHIGPTIRKPYVEEVVRRVNATNPDFIFITGDLVDAQAELVEEHVQPLANLQARFGVYYVTGNHEYYWHMPDWLDKFYSLGFIMLINENRIININNTKVLIAGITDPVGAQFAPNHRPNLKKAAYSNEKTSFKILLAHRPTVYFEAEKLGFDLQCSGHTHAGQFFPFSLLFPFLYKYYRRLNRHGNMWLYINPGTGYWGPANRFGIPAEITLLKLNTNSI